MANDPTLVHLSDLHAASEDPGGFLGLPTVARARTAKFSHVAPRFIGQKCCPFSTNVSPSARKRATGEHRRGGENTQWHLRNFAHRSGPIAAE